MSGMFNAFLKKSLLSYFFFRIVEFSEEWWNLVVVILLLNPHNGYAKIESYLLWFLFRVTSGIKFLHMLFSLSELLNNLICTVTK